VLKPDGYARSTDVAHDLCGQSIVVDREGCPSSSEGLDGVNAVFVPVERSNLALRCKFEG
jgi:hypothetical protein